MDGKTFLNQYRLTLDAAGMPVRLKQGATAGAAYAAVDIASGEQIAIELLPLAAIAPETREQLLAEAARAQQLEHPAIPRLLGFGCEGGNLVYGTERLDGTSAATWVAEHGRMPLGAVLRIALQIVSALGAATFQRVVHRAIMPRNVLIVDGTTADGEWPLVKLLRFIGGVADAGDNLAQFASPEQLRTGEVDFASEVYSLGCTLVFLLTARPPFTGRRAATPSVRGLPKNVRHLLAQMVAADPDDRPRDPLLLQQHIQGCLAQVERRGNILPVAAPMPPGRWRAPARVAAIAAAVLLMGAAAALLLHRPWHLAHTGEPIGVPIGIPEAQANAAATAVPAPTDAPAVAVVTPAPTPAAQETPALIAAAEPPAQQSAQLEPPPPAEAPNESGSEIAAPATPEEHAAHVAPAQPRSSATPPAAKRRIAKAAPKRKAARTRARFIGADEQGRWMLEGADGTTIVLPLPDDELVAEPPPYWR